MNELKNKGIPSIGLGEKAAVEKVDYKTARRN